MIIWLILALGIILYFYNKLNEQKQKISDEDKELPIVLTEESVYKIEQQFEEYLTQTYLPDAISGKEIYIFRNLMQKWFKDLVSINRYNEKVLQQLRDDWLVYMDALQSARTANYLAFESADEQEAQVHRDDCAVEARKIKTIEDAFASQIGHKAVVELNRIRSKSVFAFDDHGAWLKNYK
jgi:hypothetical protein